MDGEDEQNPLAPTFIDPEDIVSSIPVQGLGEAAMDSDSDEPDADPATATAPGDAHADGGDGDDSTLRFTGHTGSVFSVELHPHNDSLCLSGGGDDLALIWNTETGLVVHRLEGHTDSVVDVAWSCDGSLAATAGLDGIVKLWSAADGALVGTCVGPGEGVEWIKWHPRGNVLLAGSADGMGWLWSAHGGGAMMACFTGHSNAVTDGCFFNDGRSVCTASADSTVRTWDPKTGANVLVIGGHGFHEVGTAIVCVEAHPGPHLVCATGGEDNTSRIASLENGRVLATLVHPEFVEAATFNSAFPFLATGCGDGVVRIWDTNSAQMRQSFAHEPGYAIVKLQWDAAASLLYSCSTDGTVRVWDFRAGEAAQRILRGHREGVLDISPNSAGTVLVSGGDDKEALVFRSHPQ